MNQARKTVNQHEQVSTPRHGEEKTPVYLEAVEAGKAAKSSAPATPIPTTGQFRSLKQPRSFVKKFFIMSFLGSLAGFSGGIVLTIMILQGMVDVNKDAIKAMLRTVTGH